MGKGDFLTPKAIGIRIKAKGLQKLRWFCQMCQKQCRDENGFKCHINSEAHQRQMLLFNEQAGKILTGFSAQFKEGYMRCLASRYGTRRVLANAVYQDYIADRYHVHMNATCWSTLSSFAKYLGRNGDAIVEETEKGIYITYIDRRPETLERERRDSRRARAEYDEELAERLELEAQIARASNSNNTTGNPLLQQLPLPLPPRLREAESTSNPEESADAIPTKLFQLPRAQAGVANANAHANAFQTSAKKAGLSRLMAKAIQKPSAAAATPAAVNAAPATPVAAALPGSGLARLLQNKDRLRQSLAAGKRVARRPEEPGRERTRQ